MKNIIKLSLLLMTFNLYAQSSGDVNIIYENPLNQSDIKDCRVCVSFFENKEFHYFVGASIYKKCGEEAWNSHHVYGMTAMKSDLKNYKASLQEKNNKSLKYIARFCQKRAIKALQIATDLSNNYLDRYKRSNLLMQVRFAMTPFAGRPCQNVTQEIKKALILFE